MKAAVLYNAGGPENFVLEERPVPVPGEGQVLIKVKAFGLNRSELMTRKGLSPSVRFPRVLGIECVGEIVNDPSGKWMQGRKVAAVMGEMGRQFDGSYQEFAALPESIIHPFESSLDWATLGALPELFHTVDGSLQLALKIKAGETLLIRGGTSSIGMLAIPLAKQMGLTVLATTRKQERKELLLKNGADDVLIDDGNLQEKVKQKYRRGVDKVLELVGTSTLKDSLQCVAHGGIVCMTGMLAEQWSIPDFAPMDYIPATSLLTVFNTGQIEMDTARFQDFIRKVEAGVIHPAISKIFSLTEIVAAHQLMESNTASGKIVIVI